MYFSLRRGFQIKKFSTTRLFNFWRSTTFILVFFSFDIVVVILFTNLISLIYSFWNYIRELSILWTNLLSLYQKIKDLYKSCRSCEVTQLCRQKLLHLNLFSGSKLDLKLYLWCAKYLTLGKEPGTRQYIWHTANGVFAVCRFFTVCFLVGTRQTMCLSYVRNAAHGK